MVSRSNSAHCANVIDHSHIPEFEVATWIKITLILVYSIIFVIGILGNSITIHVTQLLQKKGYLQKAVADHMISLACSDILVFLIGMPVQFYSVIWNPLTTTSSNLSCKVHTFLFEACSYATLLHILTLSFERYVAICHPFRYKAVSGPFHVKLLICFVWVTSILVALPLLFAKGIEYPLVKVPNHRGLLCNRSLTQHLETSNMSICTSLSSRWTVFQSSIFSAFIIYLVVLFLVAFMCRNMMRVLMKGKMGTLAVKGQHQLRKSESNGSKVARKQTIIFLASVYLAFREHDQPIGVVLAGEELKACQNNLKKDLNDLQYLPIQMEAIEFPGMAFVYFHDFIGIQQRGITFQRWPRQYTESHSANGFEGRQITLTAQLKI